MSTCVGDSFPRFDAAEKADGAARYTDDITYPGMLFGAVVRAAIPRGRVRSIKFNPSFDWQDVIVADWRDIPGKNIVTMAKDDQQLMVKDVINHAGEAICLVAAATKGLAEAARANVVVEYDPLPAVVTLDESIAKKAIVYGDDNTITKYFVNKGDVDKAFASADLVVEGEYRTGHHEHAYIEPQGMIAIPREDGGFTLEGSLQCPYYVLKAMKTLLGVSEEKVNIRQVTMGGAFGGKEDYPSLLAGYAVLLAKKSGCPVKIVYDRQEDIMVTTKRHPSIVRHRTGVKRDGTILAMDIDVAFDGGAYTTLSPVVLARGLLHSWGPYRCANVRARATCYATNTVPNGAFRGFGAPQTLFAIESHMDVIAARLGISPLDIRTKNCLMLGDETATGQKLKESVGALECLKKAAVASNFEKKWKEYKDPNAAEKGHARHGIGVSLFMHGSGFTGSGEAIMKGRAALRLEKDGSVKVLTGCTDMGQGAHSVLPQIAADALHVPLAQVTCVTPDTAVVPDSGPTVASRTTMVVGKVLIWCAEDLLKKVEQAGCKTLDSYAKKHAPVTVERHYDLPPGIVWDQDAFHGDAYPTYSWGCNVAEVEVDTDTFETKLKKVTAACDIGRAINPQSVEGQIEGGTLQALAYGMLEEIRCRNGVPMNNKFQTYVIPTAKDAPEFNTIIVEDKFSWGPFGAKGLGELPLDGGAPAVANAVFNAVGVRVPELPITAERIFESM